MTTERVEIKGVALMWVGRRKAYTIMLYGNERRGEGGDEERKMGGGLLGRYERKRERESMHGHQNLRNGGETSSSRSVNLVTFEMRKSDTLPQLNGQGVRGFTTDPSPCQISCDRHLTCYD